MGNPNSAAREFRVTKTKGVWLKTTHLFCWSETKTSKYNTALIAIWQRFTALTLLVLNTREHPR